MHVWAIGNQKGGVGKTTTALTLGGILSRAGQRVLLVDLDPHASLTLHCGVETAGGVYKLFRRAEWPEPNRHGQLVCQTQFPYLDVMPAAPALATLDHQLGQRDGTGLVLRRGLIDLQSAYDYVLLDCPPMLGILLVSALASCDEVLVPVQTEALALQGLNRMLDTMEMVRRSQRLELPFTIIPTLFDRRTKACRMSLEALRRDHGESLWEGVIPEDTAFRDASREGAPLPMISPRSRGCVAYEALLAFLLDDALHEDPRASVPVNGGHDR